MSTSRKLVAVLLTLAALGVLRDVGGQAVGGGPVGSIFAYDMQDLSVLGEWLGNRELRGALDSSLASGEVVTALSFRRFIQGANGDRVYLGELADSGGNSWSCVLLVQSGVASVVTKRQTNGALAVAVSRPVVSSAASLDFLRMLLVQPTVAVQQAVATQIHAHKLVGLRVTHSPTARTSTHVVELFFDDQSALPALTVSGELLSGVLSNVRIDR